MDGWSVGQRWLRLATALLLSSALVQFLLRGPVDIRGNLILYDFAMHFSASRIWLDGNNPYDNRLLWPTWVARGGRSEGMLQDTWLSMLPPGSWVLFAPLALLPAPVAVALWVALCLIMVATMLWSVLWLTGLRGALAALFVAGALASAPVQTLLSVGQASLPAITLIFSAWVCIRQSRPAAAGLLLGLSACLKPQLAVPFAIYFSFFNGRRVVIAFLVISAVLTLLAVAPLQWQGHDWLGTWLRTISSSKGPGFSNDPTLSGPWRDQMIHLPLLLHSFTEDRRIVMSIALVVCAAMFGWYVRLAPRCRGCDRLETLSLGTLGALILLPVYHKSYDAAILLPAFAWALGAQHLRGASRALVVALLTSLALFLVPFNFLKLVTEHTSALDRLSHTFVWRALIHPHHAFATLGCAALLLCLLGREVRLSRASFRFRGLSFTNRGDLARYDNSRAHTTPDNAKAMSGALH